MITDDLEIYRGDAFSRTYRILDDDTPRDLTGYAIAAQIRVTPNTDTAVSFTIDMTAAASGEVTISLLPNQTADLPQRSVWDLQLTSATNADDVETLVAGDVSLVLDVTR